MYLRSALRLIDLEITFSLFYLHSVLNILNFITEVAFYKSFRSFRFQLFQCSNDFYYRLSSGVTLLIHPAMDIVAFHVHFDRQAVLTDAVLLQDLLERLSCLSLALILPDYVVMRDKFGPIVCQGHGDAL